LAAAKSLGVDRIPANDFSFYDRMLDTSAMVGAVPSRYGWKGDWVDADTYFAMARGSQGKGRDVTAMEMTKWFDTNYHYIVPRSSEGNASACRRRSRRTSTAKRRPWGSTPRRS